MSNERKTSRRFSLLLLDNPALDSELISFLLTMTRKEQQELLSTWAREGYTRLKRKKRSKCPGPKAKLPLHAAQSTPQEPPHVLEQERIKNKPTVSAEKTPPLDAPAFVIPPEANEDLPDMDFEEFDDDEAEDAQSDYNKLDRLLGCV